MPGIAATMREFKKGKLRSGSKKGPKVKSRKQAIAIGMAEERREGKKHERSESPAMERAEHKRGSKAYRREILKRS